jgi:glycosyltransferase involved in cell wall biosynthesis
MMDRTSQGTDIGATIGSSMKTRLAVFLTHPVQYFAPLWRHLARVPGLDLAVTYMTDASVRATIDPGFGVPVAWDLPLLSGYCSRVVHPGAELTTSGALRVSAPERLLADTRCDWILVHGYTHPFERQLVRAARSANVKVLMRGEFSDATGRNPVRNAVREMYLRWFYVRVDAFCSIGQDARAHLGKRRVPATRIFDSPYSVDNALFEHQRVENARAESRQRLGLPEDSFVIVFSGKLIPRKDPLLILKALRRLPSIDKIALIFIGDGPLREQVFRQGHSLLDRRLIMPGFINQTGLGQYYSAGDVLILPSRYETWGLVVNEAMQFGLPVVASDRVGCRRDLIVEAETGFVFHAGDAGALAGAIAGLLADRERCARMGELARRHIRAFSIEASANGILAAVGLRPVPSIPDSAVAAAPVGCSSVQQDLEITPGATGCPSR